MAGWRKTIKHHSLKSLLPAPSPGGTKLTKGQYANKLSIKTIDGSKRYRDRVYSNQNNKNEIPIPDIPRAYPHLWLIARHIPEIDDNASILLLIGSGAPPLH